VIGGNKLRTTAAAASVTLHAVAGRKCGFYIRLDSSESKSKGG
jgi:hypothetical protein